MTVPYHCTVSSILSISDQEGATKTSLTSICKILFQNDFFLDFTSRSNITSKFNKTTNYLITIDNNYPKFTHILNYNIF